MRREETEPDAVSEALAREVKEFIRAPGERDAAAREFERLWRKTYRYQFERCLPFRRLCERRGFSEATAPDELKDVPAVPTDAFKSYRVSCFEAAPEERIFETSGTTQGTPGRHYFRSTEIYDAAALREFERHLLPDGARLRFLALTGSPEEMPRSSLVHMIETCAARFSLGGRAEYFARGGEVDCAGLAARIAEAGAAKEPILILATAFALVQTLEALAEQGRRAPLPLGSRIMETGGYKGRARALERGELYARTADAFQIPTRAIVNEYGMTEMSSQYYDRTLSEPGLNEAETRIKIPPPWARAIVRNPVTMEPAGEGEIGILEHVDLANLDSCAFLMTADAAMRRGDGFELLGRLEEAEARGCSLDYETSRS